MRWMLTVTWRCNNNKRESCHTKDAFGQPNTAVEGELGAHCVGAGRLSGVVIEKGVGRWPSLTQSNRYLGSLARLP